MGKAGTAGTVGRPGSFAGVGAGSTTAEASAKMMVVTVTALSSKPTETSEGTATMLAAASTGAAVVSLGGRLGEISAAASTASVRLGSDPGICLCKRRCLVSRIDSW